MKQLLKWIIAAVLPAMSAVSALPAVAQSAGDSESTSLLASAMPPSKAELPTLQAWKANVKGTVMGNQLIGLLSELDTTLDTNPMDAKSLFRRGYLYGVVGCTKSAIVDLTKSIESDPSNAQAYCERGICYMDLYLYDRALKDLTTAIHVNPFSGDARLARGRLNLLLGRNQQALDDLTKCRTEDLEFSPALPGEVAGNYYKAPDYYLAACYQALGRRADAIRLYSEAASSNIATAPGYIHRYADQPADAQERIKQLQSGSF